MAARVPLLTGSLIISSDARKIFKVDKWGNEISSPISTKAFSPANPFPDGLALDPSDKTLWVSTEYNSGGKSADIRVWNIDFDTGSLVGSFGVNEFDPDADEIEGICIDPRDFTVWLVADAPRPRLYHLRRNGSLIRAYDLAASGMVSPQDLCIDPVLSLVVLTDNNLNSLYFFDLEGISFVKSVVLNKLDPVPVVGLQGISYDPANGLYWITYYRPEDWIVLVDREGRPQHKFSNANYTDISQANPVGIAAVF